MFPPEAPESFPASSHSRSVAASIPWNITPVSASVVLSSPFLCVSNYPLLLLIRSDCIWSPPDDPRSSPYLKILNFTVSAKSFYRILGDIHRFQRLPCDYPLLAGGVHFEATTATLSPNHCTQHYLHHFRQIQRGDLGAAAD